jgi:hypothetical protein
VRRLEVVELRLEEGVVATPAVNKEERRLAAALAFVVQLEVVLTRVRQ